MHHRSTTPFLAIILVVLVNPFPHVTSAGQQVDEFFSRLSNEFNLHSYLDQDLWSSQNSDVSEEKEEFVSREEATKYLSLLRFIDAKKSPLVRKLREVVQGESSQRSPDSEIRLADRISRLLSGDLSVMEELTEKLMIILKENANLKPGEEMSDKLKALVELLQGVDPENYRAQAEPYMFEQIEVLANMTKRELCVRQYGAFVEPITNRTLNVIREIICDRIPGWICRLIPIAPEPESPPWGGRMIDAMTKIPHSIRDGQLQWVGDYDYCQLTKSYNYNFSYSYSPVNLTNVTIPIEFTGKYCRIDLVPIPVSVPGNETVATNETVAANETASSGKLQLGICVPSTCHSTDVVYYITEVNIVLRAVLFILEADVNFAFCGVEDVDQWSDAAYLVNFCIVATVVGIILLATIYDGFFRKSVMNKKIISLSNDLDQAELEKDEKGATEESKKRTLKKISFGMRMELLFVGFSAYSNMRRIFTTHRKPGDIPVLNGIRWLTFCWIIWGQTFVYGPIYFESWVTANILYALRHIPTQFVYQAVINFHLTEDSFLLISGILLSYWYLKKHENIKLTFKNVAKNAIYSLIHRYWRLVPAMMMCLMIFTCTYKFFSDGPMFPHEDRDGENCRVTWWVPLTMTHNLVKTNQQCFGHAWFVPVIFQLHLAALVVLIPLVLKPWLGYILLTAMYIAHIGATAGLSYNLREDGDFGSWYDDYFVTPWCRAGPFIIGLAFGIIIYHKSKTGFKINTVANVILWLLAIFTVAAVSFWTLDQYKDLPDELHRWSMGALVAYDTLARSAWALGLGWIVLACHFGHGGVVESLLTWSAFTPVSRLVYTSLLMHGMMIFNMVYTTRHAIVVEGYHSSYASLAHTIVCTLTGLVMSLVWHYPLSMGISRVFTCPTRIAWIRSGRHSRTRLQELNDEFFPRQESVRKGSDTRPPLFVVSGVHENNQPIAGCNYVRASPVDVAQLGLSDMISGGTGMHDNKSDSISMIKGGTGIHDNKSDSISMIKGGTGMQDNKSDSISTIEKL